MPNPTLADLTARTTMAEGKKGRKWVKDDKPEADEKPAFAKRDPTERRKAMYPKMMKGKSDG